MRTFSRLDWNAALAAWDEGQFSDEWKPYRHQAAMRGMIYPPEGTRWDSWEDSEPSQRALLIRAIRDTPALTHEAIAHSRTWGQVIEYILARRDEWREGLRQRERDELRADPTPKEAATSLAGMFERVASSLGYERKETA